MNESFLKCDVLVIGGGAAAMRAAIEAGNTGANVIMASKSEYGCSGSSFYEKSLPWGMMMAGNEDNSKNDFLKEILDASCGCLNTELAKVLVENSNTAFNDLQSYGIEFSIYENQKPCFGQKPRGAALKSLNNAGQCFKKQLAARDILIINNLYITDLLVIENVCCGAVGFDKDNNAVVISAKTTIIASGGAEYLWKYGFGLPDMSGDGYSMAAKAGARLANLEFIQFIPGTLSPTAGINFHHPTLETLPEILNYQGDSFIKKYLPDEVSYEECLKERAAHGPFSFEDSSKYFDIAIFNEDMPGKNCDCRGAAVKYNESYYQNPKYKMWDDLLKSKGIDTGKDNFTIYPHCQAFNGGVMINKKCETNVENLYACGECAAGPHGANRIGGNAVLATQVFGKIAGENAARKAKKISFKGTPDCSALLKREYDTGVISRVDPDMVLKTIKDVMQRNACIVRKGTDLKNAIQDLKTLQSMYNPYGLFSRASNIKMVFCAWNALITARLILYSMLNRNESRGGHYRADFPFKAEGKFGTMHFIKLDGNNNVISIND